MDEGIQNYTSDEIMRIICTANFSMDLTPVEVACKKALFLADGIQKRPTAPLYLLKELRNLLEKCEGLISDVDTRIELRQRLNALNSRIVHDDRIYQEFLHVEA